MKELKFKHRARRRVNTWYELISLSARIRCNRTCKCVYIHLWKCIYNRVYKRVYKRVYNRVYKRVYKRAYKCVYKRVYKRFYKCSKRRLHPPDITCLQTCLQMRRQTYLQRFIRKRSTPKTGSGMNHSNYEIHCVIRTSHDEDTHAQMHAQTIACMHKMNAWQHCACVGT